MAARAGKSDEGAGAALDGGHLAREDEEAISDGAAKPGEKFWEKEVEEGGGISAAAAFTSVRNVGGLHHTHMARPAHNWLVGWGGGGGSGVRGQRSDSCCDTSRILLPTSLWGVFLSVCVCVATCHKRVPNRACQVVFVPYEKCSKNAF